MSDEELIARLRKADEYEPLGHDGWEAADRIEVLVKERDEFAAKLAGDRLGQWIEQGMPAVTQPAPDAAADRIEALTEQLAAARRDAEEAEAYAGELEKGRDVASIWNEAVDEALDILDDEGWLGESRERIELLKKPLGAKDE